MDSIHVRKKMLSALLVVLYLGTVTEAAALGMDTGLTSGQTECQGFVSKRSLTCSTTCGLGSAVVEYWCDQTNELINRDVAECCMTPCEKQPEHLLKNADVSMICTDSSHLADSDCGQLRLTDGNAWKTDPSNQEGPAWLEFDFEETVVLSELRFYKRCSKRNQFQGVTAIFDHRPDDAWHRPFACDGNDHLDETQCSRVQPEGLFGFNPEHMASDGTRRREYTFKHLRLVFDDACETPHTGHPGLRELDMLGFMLPSKKIKVDSCSVNLDNGHSDCMNMFDNKKETVWEVTNSEETKVHLLLDHTSEITSLKFWPKCSIHDRFGEVKVDVGDNNAEAHMASMCSTEGVTDCDNMEPIEITWDPANVKSDVRHITITFSQTCTDTIGIPGIRDIAFGGAVTYPNACRKFHPFETLFE